MVARGLQPATELREREVGRLQSLDPRDIRLTQIAKLMEMAARLEQRARGASADTASQATRITADELHDLFQTFDLRDPPHEQSPDDDEQSQDTRIAKWLKR